MTANEPYSIESCASACKDETTPNGKKAMGFAYKHDGGECMCKSQASHPHPDCEPNTDINWARYDFVNYSPVFEYQHDGRCQHTLPSSTSVSITGSSASSTHGTYASTNAHDGNTATFSHTKWDGSSTYGGAGDHWLQLDKESGIRHLTSVKITNRLSCCSNKLANFRIE